MGYFKHPNALVEVSQGERTLSDSSQDERAQIGDGTRIWAFTHVLPGARIGADCNICDHVFIENDVVVGDRVTVKCGVQLWDGVRLEDDVFVGPNATFTNDPYPRSKQYPAEYTKTVIKKGASIGANATILPGIVVGMHAMVGAGAVVTKDVPPYAVVVGNPARIKGYDTAQRRPRPSDRETRAKAERETDVKGVCWYDLPEARDLRGSLSAGEYGDVLPFAPQRYFLVYDVPSRDVRGEHAHRVCQQFLVCVHGSCTIMVDDGKNRAEYRLDRPTAGIYIPPMVWASQYNYTPDAVLMVLASDVYKPEDYIRDYEEFLREVAG